MLVELLTYTPDPERLVAAAARLCYSPAAIRELLDQEPAQRRRLLDRIREMGHLSVLEHVAFSFGIEGISRACSHQLVRHRLASYSQQSQRYVSHQEPFAAVTPDSIAAMPVLLQRFQGLLAEIHAVYGELLAAGIPAEDARFVLPNAAQTKLVMTMNARELLHFFQLRCCRRAQWEIRRLATAMLRLVKPVAPLLFAGAGPACLEGACPEGQLSCGALAEVRREFEAQ